MSHRLNTLINIKTKLFILSLLVTTWPFPFHKKLKSNKMIPLFGCYMLPGSINCTMCSFFTIAICRSHTHHTYLIFSEHKFYETIMCPWSPRPFSWYLKRHQRWPGTFSWMKWRRVYKRIEYLADLWMFQFCYCHLLITPFWLPLRGIYLNKIH